MTTVISPAGTVLRVDFVPGEDRDNRNGSKAGWLRLDFGPKARIATRR